MAMSAGEWVANWARQVNRGAAVGTDGSDIISNIDTTNGKDCIETTMQVDYTFGLGLKGYTWDEASGGKSPSDAALGTGANWDKVAAHDDLQQRERELAAEKERVAKQAHENELAATCNAEQAAANEAEAQRLRDEAVSLQAAKSAAATATVAAASAEKPAKAAKN
ncbi:major capsid protein [Janthinobacterium sp. GMG1]|nr:major capsid protein [Janthinobacterium sp. GMG1]MDZ5633492.1 major capsid protein [Janthinobacterium sp. GMG1]